MLLYLTSILATIATGFSVYNYLIGLWDRKMKKLRDNRELYYLPLSIQTGFSDEFKTIYSTKGEQYQLRPLELMFHQGFVKTARLFLTDLNGMFSVRKLSYTEEELTTFFKKEEPYKEPQPFDPSILLSVFHNERLLIDVHFLLIEGFSGDAELFMVFYAYDVNTHKTIMQEVFDKYHLVSTGNQKLVIPELSERDQEDINYVLSLAFIDFKSLYKKLKDEL